MRYLDYQAILTAREELGLPTDSAAMSQLENDLEDRLSDLLESLQWTAERAWFQQNPGQLISSEVTISLHEQARHQAVEQIMEDEVNEPMRQLLIQREEEEERQRNSPVES